jgi:putative ABC transport system permease protein
VKYWPMVWRNLTRNKLRTLLTGGAIALAIALVCLLLTMPAGFDRILDSVSENTRLSVHAKAGFVYSMPVSYLQKVRSMSGVESATSYDWFGGAVDADEGVTFPNFAVDADAIGSVFADYGISQEALDDFVRNRDAALVGRDTLERYRWSVGDRITLDSTRYGIPLEFRIVGSINPPGGGGGGPSQVLWFQREYLRQALQDRPTAADQISMIWARVDDVNRVDPLMREIDDLFRTSEVETATETEKSFVSNFFGLLKGLVVIILVVTGLVSLCLVFIAANTASMAVRERMREIAILKALGFPRGAIFGTLLAEAVLLSTIAGVIGAGFALLLPQALRAGSSLAWDLGPLGSFIVGPWIVVQGLFLALFIGMLSGIVPSWGAARRGVVATLREVF